MNLDVKTNFPLMSAYLNGDLPDGVRITSGPSYLTRSAPDFNVDINITVSLVVDLAKIAPFVFAAWLVKRTRSAKGNHQIHIKGKQIPVEQSDAIDLIAKEIDSEQQKQ
jgi:hypothetical protein